MTGLRLALYVLYRFIMTMAKAIQYYGELFNPKQNITPEIRRAIDATIPYGLGLIRSRSPVKTGALKAGWQAKPAGQGIEWTNEVPYTIYQEMGTRFFPAKAMLSQSMPEIKQEFMRQLNRNIGKKYGGKEARNAEAREKGLQKKGAPRAAEMTSNVPRFSAPSYERLTGSSSYSGGFRGSS
jgi:hypothetical protein